MSPSEMLEKIAAGMDLPSEAAAAVLHDLMAARADLAEANAAAIRAIQARADAEMQRDRPSESPPKKPYRPPAIKTITGTGSAKLGGTKGGES